MGFTRRIGLGKAVQDFPLIKFVPLRMIRRSKRLARKEIRIQQKLSLFRKIPTKTCCGYTIVERIVMAKQEASEPLLREPKKQNSSTDFVYYQPASHPMIKKVSSTKIGNRPIYRCFIDYDGKYIPLRCMLELGSTSFVISPEAAKAFSIPVVSRPKPVLAGDVSRSQLKTEGLYTVPLGVSFGNHRSFDDNDHAFGVIKTSGDYDALIPAWYLEKHQARGTTTGHLHFPHCEQKCYNHGKIHPEYSITYNK